MICKHKHTIKTLLIPTNGNKELNYEKLLETIQTIIKNKQLGFMWNEFLICTDCNKVIEHIEVFISK